MVAEENPLCLYQLLCDLDTRINPDDLTESEQAILFRSRVYGRNSLKQQCDAPDISPSMLAAIGGHLLSSR